MVPSPVFGTFLLSADLIDGWAVIALRGELDVATAPILAEVLTTAMDGGARRLILDLVELGFIDAAGLGVIVGAVTRLQAGGGSLTIRSPSPMVRRILDITGLADLDQSVVPGRRGASERHEDRSQAGVLAAAGVGGRRFSKVTSLPSGDAVVDGALRQISVGIAVAVIATVAASDQTILDMDAGQYSTGQGPCVDASIEGRRFLTEALDTEQRWPDFTPKAQALGINAILSSPLLASDRPIGALNIYSRTADAFAPEDQELPSLFAAEASTLLTEASLDATDEQVASRFQQALRSREVIAQAQGVLMERTGVSEDEAFRLLRQFSVGTNTALQDRAGDVVDSTRRSPAEPPAPPAGGRP